MIEEETIGLLLITINGDPMADPSEQSLHDMISMFPVVLQILQEERQLEIYMEIQSND